MKFLSLKFYGKGQQGWDSEKLVFGEDITQLYGPNGCGKTPIVQAIAYCIGYPCIFRNDIYEKCNYCELDVEFPAGGITIKRVFSKREFDVQVTEWSGEKLQFYNELEFSNYLFEMLNIEPPQLVSISNKMSQTYFSSIIPMFYLDQDDGYSTYYCPASKFLKDQYSEVMRILFELPSKNSFDVKKSKIDAKAELDYLDKEVDVSSNNLRIAKKHTSSIGYSKSDLLNQVARLDKELQELKQSGSTYDDAINSFDRHVSANKNKIYNLRNKVHEISIRNNGINSIVKEINLEIETLNLNEQARRHFLSFQEICKNPNCQLFGESSESYSKNLLYLKDQIKDLERNVIYDESKKSQLNEQISELEGENKLLNKQKEDALGSGELRTLLNAITGIKNQIYKIQNDLNEFEKVEKLGEKHFDLLSKRDKALDKYQSLSKSEALSTGIQKVRSALKQKYISWLNILKIRNVSLDLEFRSDFSPLFGIETINQLKGSTKIRAILAFHAAVMDLLIEYGLNKYNFLILDTPKQHEISNEDLDSFFKALKKVASNADLQIIFSTTEYKFQGDSADITWEPKFRSKDQNMFLKDPEYYRTEN